MKCNKQKVSNLRFKQMGRRLHFWSDPKKDIPERVPKINVDELNVYCRPERALSRTWTVRNNVLSGGYL